MIDTNVILDDIPEEEWYRLENTHESLIDKDVFRQVQERLAKSEQGNSNAGIFTHTAGLG